MVIKEYESPPAPPRIEINGPNDICLRQLMLEDAEVFVELVKRNSGHLSKAHYGGREQLAQSLGSLENVRKYIVDGETVGLTMFGIYRGDELVGGISANRHENNLTEIGGLWVDESDTGQGYASESIGLLSEYLFKNGSNKIYARAYAGNNVSQRSFLKNGFIWEKQVMEEDARTGDVKTLDQFILEKPARP
jgi:RimJ/RimL family protein N-acetyltransferase